MTRAEFIAMVRANMLRCADDLEKATEITRLPAGAFGCPAFVIPAEMRENTLRTVARIREEWEGMVPVDGPWVAVMPTKKPQSKQKAKGAAA